LNSFVFPLTVRVISEFESGNKTFSLFGRDDVKILGEIFPSNFSQANLTPPSFVILVPRVSDLFNLVPRDGKKRDPGNEVAILLRREREWP